MRDREKGNFRRAQQCISIGSLTRATHLGTRTENLRVQSAVQLPVVLVGPDWTPTSTTGASAHDLLGGERRSQVLAVDDHDDAEQEQSADALFDLHPQREGAGERDDGRDGHQHDG